MADFRRARVGRRRSRSRGPGSPIFGACAGGAMGPVGGGRGIRDVEREGPGAVGVVREARGLWVQHAERGAWAPNVKSGNCRRRARHPGMEGTDFAVGGPWARIARSGGHGRRRGSRGIVSLEREAADRGIGDAPMGWRRGGAAMRSLRSMRSRCDPSASLRRQIDAATKGSRSAPVRIFRGECRYVRKTPISVDVAGRSVPSPARG